VFNINAILIIFNLAILQHKIIYEIILSKFFAIVQIIEVANCNKYFIKVICSNFYYFNTIKASLNNIEQS